MNQFTPHLKNEKKKQQNFKTSGWGSLYACMIDILNKSIWLM